MFKVISSGLSPNLEKDDISLAVSLLLKPSKWRNKLYLSNLKRWFSNYFYTKNVYLTNAGRSALYLLLKSAGIGKGDEVLVQAFTCVGAVEPILWLGASPVYADIEKKTFNIDPMDSKKKITKKTKAIIVQHTFGIPADIDKLDKIASNNKLLLIEDCAHSLGAKLNGGKVGTFGDAAFFSFGRDKVVSSVFGGAAVVHRPDKFENIDKLYKDIKEPTRTWTFKQLLHPIASWIILPIYRLQIGKILLFLLQKLGLLSKPYSSIEYGGGMPKNYPGKLSPALAKLALNQLNKLERFNKKRRKIASKYGKVKKGAIYLRYPILVDKPKRFYKNARKKGIILGRWYSNIIDPIGADFGKFNYKIGTCPIAEESAKKIINLPTYPRMSEEEITKAVRFISQAIGCGL
jgi:dTDP-4-amino-4,6-dideoxygalactose transaminase